jgi:hypothetical protein
MPAGDPMMKCGHVAQGYLEENDLSIPICVICDCTEQVEKPSLEGRMARCTCMKKVPSKWSLAFFEYRGPGSKFDTESCNVCGYNRDIHPSEGGDGLYTNGKPIQYLCENNGKGMFTPGPHEYDSYYCGCNGWD